MKACWLMVQKTQPCGNKHAWQTSGHIYRKSLVQKQSIAFNATAKDLRLILPSQSNSPTNCFE